MLENKTAFTCLNLPERIARYNEQRPQHVANINKATENLSSAIIRELPDIQKRIQEIYKITSRLRCL